MLRKVFAWFDGITMLAAAAAFLTALFGVDYGDDYSDAGAYGAIMALYLAVVFLNPLNDRNLLSELIASTSDRKPKVKMFLMQILAVAAAYLVVCGSSNAHPLDPAVVTGFGAVWGLLAILILLFFAFPYVAFKVASYLEDKNG